MPASREKSIRLSRACRFSALIFHRLTVSIYTTGFNIENSAFWPVPVAVQSAADRLMGLRLRIPPGALKSVCWEYCVLSGRGLCVELITSPEEPYRPWCAVVCDLETSRMRKPWPALGRNATGQFCFLPTQCVYVVSKQRL
jgi:hypothetical protein